MYEVLTLIRFGRFDEVLEVTKRPEREVPGGGVGLRAGLRLSAQEAGRLRRASTWPACRRRPTTAKAEFRSHSAKNLLGILGGILEGEIARAAGDLPGAIAAFERAVVADDALEYDEPEPTAVSRAALAGRGAARSTSEHADAERVYREDLKDHPHNGWSLLGLQQALKAQGKTATRGRQGPRGELVAVGYLDPRVAVLMRAWGYRPRLNSVLGD